MTGGGATAAAVPTAVMPSARRRRLVWETILLLGLSLGQSAVYAILRIIERSTRPDQPLKKQTSTLNVSVTPDRPWLDLLYQLANTFFLVVPALMACFLVATVLPPPGRLRAMGLDGSRKGFDIVWGWLITAAIGVPGLGLYLGAKAMGINTTVAAANLTDTWWTIPVLIAAAFANGFLEEVVMIGYLFTRWGQAGWRAATVVLVSSVVRGSYHLYQGWGGFIGNLLMGVAFGLFFLKTKRLWPLVLAHGLIDCFAFVGYSLLKPHVGWL